ncbi:MAG: chorismate mutase [Oscillospiraceae bacterium]|nr:chorismate mutase [Oscillospiraceae bacterium]
MNINEIKNEIEQVNSEMLRLFIRNLEIVDMAGKLRTAEGKPLYDRKGEEEIIETAVANTPQNMQNYTIEFFRSLINLSKEYYKDNK